jgi:AcrR family transcriptional regulator
VNGEETRVRLREAALQRFGREGVLRTSTRDILRATGLRNSSAITYHFGSKAALIDDLVTELITEAWPVVQLQVDLAERGTPTVEEWANVAADSGAKLLETERGCLLARLWWEYDCFLHPDAFEDFLASGIPLAVQWQAAIRATFPDKSPMIAVAQNVVVIRTLEWLLARRARKLLGDREGPTLGVGDPRDVRQALMDVTLALLTAPTTLTDEQMRFE